MTYPHLEWHENHTTTVYNGKIFSIVESERKAADGRTARYSLVDSPDWAHVIAVVPDEKGRECFVMVRQYRQGGRFTTLEFPGGVIDDGEDSAAAALRELREETGFEADGVQLIGKTNPNPAFMTNTVFTYLAHGVRQSSAQDLDTNEIVDVEIVPIERLEAVGLPSAQAVEGVGLGPRDAGPETVSREGARPADGPAGEFFSHGIMIIGWHWYRRYLRTRT